MGFKEGDMVKRKSYEGDVIFKIAGIAIDDAGEQTCVLKGVSQRLVADAYVDDLVRATEEDIERENRIIAERLKEFELKRNRQDTIHGR